MGIFRLLPFERFHALVQILSGYGRLCEPFV